MDFRLQQSWVIRARSRAQVRRLETAFAELAHECRGSFYLRRESSRLRAESERQRLGIRGCAGRSADFGSAA